MERPWASKSKEPSAPPTREQLELEASQDKKLAGNRKNAEVLIKKLIADEESEEGAEPSPDSFDGQTIQLLEKVLVSKEHNQVARAILPTVAAGGDWFWRKILTPVLPKVAGMYGGIEGAPMAMDWAHKYVTEDVAARGRALIKKAVLEESGVFDPHKGAAGTISGWLASAEQATRAPDSPGFSAGVLEGLKGLAQQATHGAAEGAHSTIEQLIKWVNELWIYISHMINLAVQNGGKVIVDGMAETGGFAAGLVSYPVGAVGAYLGVSFTAGAGLGIINEIKRSAGFEQVVEYVDRSEAMIVSGQKNEDGTDPRHELIVLEKRILQDPKQMGHKLSNEEWLRFSAAVRNARVSLLKEKINHQDNILHSDAEQKELGRRAEAISRFVDGQGELADADEELAAQILARFSRSLKKESESAEETVFNYNSFLEKSKRYARAFVRGGINGTGIAPLMRTMGRVMSRTAKMSIPGAGLVFKK